MIPKNLSFKRRIGPHPHANNQETSGRPGCPDIWELESGHFAIIGVDRTKDLLSSLPEDASCGEDEKIVIIDRHILVNAKSQIPSD